MRGPRRREGTVQLPSDTGGTGNAPAAAPPVGVARDLREDVLTAALDLFASYGIRFLVAQATADATGPAASAPPAGLLGVCGFGGSAFAGHVVFGASAGTLRRSNSTRSSCDDWMAELANQFLGRIKNQLLRNGIHVQRVPPVVIKGAAVAPANGPEDKSCLALADGQDWVFIRLDFQPSTDDASPAEEPATDVMQEGDMVLF